MVSWIVLLLDYKKYNLKQKHTNFALQQSQCFQRSVELGKWILDLGELSEMRLNRLDEWGICLSEDCCTIIWVSNWNSSGKFEISSEDICSVFRISRLYNMVKNNSKRCKANKHEANTLTAIIACWSWQSIPNLWDNLWISASVSDGFKLVQFEYSPQKTAYSKAITLNMDMIPIIRPIVKWLGNVWWLV